MEPRSEAIAPPPCCDFRGRDPLSRTVPSKISFITLEGIEGSGKSTQAKLLADFLTDAGHEIVLTREPGGTEVTKQIRSLLSNPENAIQPHAELLLFLADRAQHVATVIAPAIQNGKIVICDRYSDSTTAYQGYGRGHDLEFIGELNNWASVCTDPDLTLWIDCDIKLGVGRANKRTGGPGDRFELEPMEFHRRVRDGFAKLATQHPERIIRVEGDGSIELVAGRIRDAVERRIG